MDYSFYITGILIAKKNVLCYKIYKFKIHIVKYKIVKAYFQGANRVENQVQQSTNEVKMNISIHYLLVINVYCCLKSKHTR